MNQELIDVSMLDDAELQEEKERFRDEFDFIENELSNAFVLLSETIEDHSIKTKMVTSVITDRAEDATLADVAVWIFQHRKNH